MTTTTTTLYKLFVENFTLFCGDTPSVAVLCCSLPDPDITAY